MDGTNVIVSITLNLLDLHTGPVVDADRNGVVSSDELEKIISNILESFRENFKVRAPELPSQSHLDHYQLIAPNTARLRIVYQFEHEIENLRVVSTLHKITQPNHRHLLQIRNGDETLNAVLSAKEQEIYIDDPTGVSFWVLGMHFIELGIEHIFNGYDHLIFLVGLLMATNTFALLAKVITSFTLSHSLTLTLATFDLVFFPSRLIESLIALSIVYIGIENFTGHNLIHRWKIAFLFGLVHGFGFSNVLRQMELPRQKLAASLFSFNIGVELGQLILAATLFPVVIWLSHTRWKSSVGRITSLVVIGLGSYWFILRILLP